MPPNRDLPAQVLEQAQRSGVELAEVYQMRAHSQIACFDANALKQLEHLESEGIALRVWKDHKPGLAVAQGAFDIETLVRQAIALSQLNTPQEIQLSRQRLHDPSLNRGHAVSAEQLVEWGKDAIAELTTLNPAFSCSVECECESESIYLLNSAGMECGYTDITLSTFLSAEWVRDYDFLCIEASQIQREHLDLQTILRTIEERLDWANVQVSPPTGAVPVLLTQRATAILWTTVQAALNAKQVIEGASPWTHQLSQRVVSPQLTLTQLPSIGPYSCPFDDEGVQSRPLEFIEQGQLQMFYTDQITGNILGSGSTGNGFRPNLNCYPTPELINLRIEPGHYSFSQMIETIEDGMIVDQVLGEHHSITGDLLINIDLGYRIKHGRVVGRVKDAMLVGNVYEGLKHIQAIGNDNQWNDIYYTPSMVMGGFSITS